jgi:hypothetical protein
MDHSGIGRRPEILLYLIIPDSDIVSYGVCSILSILTSHIINYAECCHLIGWWSGWVEEKAEVFRPQHEVNTAGWNHR